MRGALRSIRILAAAGLGAALLVVALCLAAGHYLTRAAPAATGLPDGLPGATAIRFASASGTPLSAWFARGESGAGAILLLHAVRANKRAMLPRARLFKSHGFSVLLVDLQAHGESGGERIGFGYREAADVRAALATLRQLVPGERIGVLGTSLGAAALVLSDTQDEIAAVVLESLYPTLDEAVTDRLRLHFGAAAAWFAPLLLAQVEPWLGVSPNVLRPVERVPLLRCPVLMVHGSDDRHTTLAEARRVFAAIRAPKEFYVVMDAAHVDLHAAGGGEYERRIGGFFARHLR